MNDFAVRKKKWIYLAIAAVFIVVGITLGITVGFGDSTEFYGGWRLTTRVSKGFSFEDTPKNEVYGFLLSFFTKGASLREGEFSKDFFRLITITSKTPIDISADEFYSSVNEKYEGLLIEGWTAVHRLKPSFVDRDSVTLLLTAAIAIIFISAIAWVVSDIKSAALTVLGMLVNPLLTLSAAVFLRLPATSVLIAAASVSSVFGLALSTIVLKDLNAAASAPKKTDIDAKIDERLNIAVKNVSFCSLTLAGAFLAFAVAGLIFRANPAWYSFSAAMCAALLAPQYYAVFVLPGLYKARERPLSK